MTIYKRMQDLADSYGVTKQVIRKRVREIEAKIGTRYNKKAIINDDRIILVNELVYLDWMSVRQMYKAGVPEKNIEPFNAKEWRYVLGES